ncbi:hypothetical protein DITRI_Ditri20bG0029500 [Diplodiscus trichospermus]
MDGPAKVIEKRVVTPLSKDELISFIHSVVLTEHQQEMEPFYVLDVGAVKSLFDTWALNLPMVQPFYVVKCNPNLAFLKELAALGTSFDCASRAEIETVLSLGVSPDRIVFANPFKPMSHIKYAATFGVNLATFDSKCKLEKITKWHPKCELLIRIKVPKTSGATFQLGSKYGALPEEIIRLLLVAQSAQLNVVGVSFHIGSEAVNFHAHEEAIAVAKTTFEAPARLGIPKMKVLNIGGGSTSGLKFTEAASAVKVALKRYFPNEPAANGLTIMAEPGRFFANSPFAFATSIIGKRVRGEIREYWINNGIYGFMNFLNYDHDEIICTPLANNGSNKNPTYKGLKT